jgi:uncharacterized protein YjiS (DUF1127 family)
MSSVPAFEVRSLPTRAAPAAARWLSRLWTRYWKRRTRVATVAILWALDDRTLKDLGLHRSEIGSLVYGVRRERPFR